MCICLLPLLGFPLDKAVSYAKLRNPLLINDLNMQYFIQDRYSMTGMWNSTVSHTGHTWSVYSTVLYVQRKDMSCFGLCRREVYRILLEEGIDLPRYVVLNRDPDRPEGNHLQREWPVDKPLLATLQLETACGNALDQQSSAEGDDIVEGNWRGLVVQL